jgi:hypothetical protein
MSNHRSQSQDSGPLSKAISEKPKNHRRTRRDKGQPIEAIVFEELEQIHLHAAGIDIGAEQNYVCVPSRSVKDGRATCALLACSRRNMRPCRSG